MFGGTELAKRLEASDTLAALELAETLGRIRPGMGARTLSIGGGCAAYCGVDTPLSHVLGVGMDGPVEIEQLEAIEEFYRNRDCPTRIELCPLADQSFVELLGLQGHRLVEFENVWVLDLTKYVPQEISPAITVSRTMESDADLWIRTATRGFMERDDLGPEALDTGAALFYRTSGACWLARADGNVIATAAMAMRDGLAALYGASTLQAYRGLGAQTALLQARLAVALEAGCDLAMVTTKPGNISARNVERAGFRLAYTKANLIKP